MDTACIGDDLAGLNDVPLLVLPGPSQPDASLRTSKILIVDDESTNGEVVEKYLKRKGYQNFVTTTDARQARRCSALAT